MAGRDPAIQAQASACAHAAPPDARDADDGAGGNAWMPGSSPGMTSV